MTQTVDAIVIGAGIVGACSAYALHEAGLRVTVLDALGPAKGITRWCPGGVRQQWGNDLNIMLVRDSLPFFHKIGMFHDALMFEQCGYAFATHTADGKAQLQTLVDRQQRLNVPARLIDADELAELIPGINKSSIVAASYGKTDGFVNDAPLLTSSIITYLAQQGHTYAQEQVTDVITQNGRVQGVRTDKQTWQAPIVINAAGQNARAIAEHVGMSLPTTPEERRLHYMNNVPNSNYLTPFLASLEKRWAGKQLGEDFYMSYLGDLPENNDAFIELTYSVGEELLPDIRSLNSNHIVQGFYATTPDHQAIVDESDTTKGFFVATGFSGHGFMMAPAVGQGLTQLALGQDCTYDFSDYALARFNQTALSPESVVI